MKEEKTDQLERFVRNNRNQFDLHKPSSHLWDAIDDQLGEEKNLAGKTFLMYSRRIAAAIILLLAAYGGYNIVLNSTTAKQQKEILSQDLQTNEKIKELYEAQIYYSHQVSNTMHQLESYCEDFPVVCREVLQETKVMKQEMQQLEGDLKENIGNERVLEAMVRNYRIKLRIMENLLDNVKRAKTEEENTHETTEI